MFFSFTSVREFGAGVGQFLFTGWVRIKLPFPLRLAGVLLGCYDKSAKLDSQVHQMLIEMFGEQLVFDTTISRTVRHREATFGGKTIFEHAPNQPASLEYVSLAQEMINRGQKAAAGETANPLPGNEALDTLESATPAQILEVANA